jgi:hypothetical protein
LPARGGHGTRNRTGWEAMRTARRVIVDIEADYARRVSRDRHR